MARFRNGEVPAGLLIEIGSGRNEDGEWKHLLPRSTARKVARLIKLGEERRGRTLTITPGYNCYRPRPWQVLARSQACDRGRCNDAAVPGSSSHGGEYQGRDSIAIDFLNWLWVWGSREAFYAACREVGLTPGVFDWEPWHVCDFDDPFREIPDEDEEEEDDMPSMNEFLNTPAFDDGPTISEMFKRTNEVYNAMFYGGPSMEDGGRSASFSLKNVTEFVDRIDGRVLGVHQAVFDGGTSMPDGGLSLGQSLADAREALAGIGRRLDAIEGALREPKAS